MSDPYGMTGEFTLDDPLTDPAFTMADFAAWLRTQPATTVYDTDSIAKCALAQFLKATGRMKSDGWVGTFTWTPSRLPCYATYTIEPCLAYILTGHHAGRYVPLTTLLATLDHEISHGWISKHAGFQRWITGDNEDC